MPQESWGMSSISAGCAEDNYEKLAKRHVGNRIREDGEHNCDHQYGFSPISKSCPVRPILLAFRRYLSFR